MDLDGLVLFDNGISIGVDFSLSFFVLVVNLFVSKVSNSFDGFSYELFLDDLDNFALLKSFTVDIEWQVITVDYTFNEAEVSRHKVEFVTDEDFAHVEAEAGAHFVGAALLESEWDVVGKVENRFEVDVTPVKWWKTQRGMSHHRTNQAEHIKN